MWNRRETVSKLFTCRMDERDLDRMTELQRRLQERAEPHMTITQRLTIVYALDALEAKLERLERDRERKR